MKPIAVFVLVAVFSLATVAASAKTVTMPVKNADEQSVNAVAGPPPSRKHTADNSSAQPSKKALKKSKVKTPPPMHDPN